MRNAVHAAWSRTAASLTRSQRLQPGKIVARMVGRPRQGACRNQRKTLGASNCRQLVKFIRRYEAHHRMMLEGRLQVLPDGEEVNVGGAQIIHNLQDFITVLAKSDHDPGLGENSRIDFFGTLKQANGCEITRSRPDSDVFG